MEYIAFIAGIGCGAAIMQWRYSRLIDMYLRKTDDALAKNAKAIKQAQKPPEPWAIGRVVKIEFDADGIAHVDLDGGIGFLMSANSLIDYRIEVGKNVVLNYSKILQGANQN
jgi:hypothetical protein